MPSYDAEGAAAASRAPTVSVVIPVKDDETELARCLRALARQTRPADELVVVDNGSVDGSAATAAAGAIVIPCAAPGIPAANACGLDAATGDILLRLDADCVPPPSWIADVLSTFARHPEASVLTGSARFIDGPRPLRAPLAWVYLASYALASAPALGHRPLFGSNLALRREAWDAVRATVHRDDPELHDDLDLSFHLGERHRIRRVRGPAMGISMRPFFSARSYLRRVYRGVRTIVIHWPHDFAPTRWRRRRAVRRRA